MEPPKIIRDADPQEGRGCWMGCFGIGCLLMVVAFFGLIVGGWYTVWHTRLPLVLLEQAIEQDGKVKIEGLTGSVSRGAHIDELRFLTVDDEHWSFLRGIKFDYNGLFEMSRTGRMIIDQMSVDSGTIYADIESPNDFLFSPTDLHSMNEFSDSDLKEFRVSLLQVNDLKIINLETDYSIEIENASLRDFHVNGEDGVVDVGELKIQSNVLEAASEPSDKWPDRPNAKRIRGKLRAQFSERMKSDVAFVFDLDFDKEGGRRAVDMFDGKWGQEFSSKRRSIRLNDFSPQDYFRADQILPSRIQLNATYQSEDRDESDDVASSWDVAPGASFQLGKTTFEIVAAEGNSAPLRSIIGTATIDGEVFVADLRCRDYFQKGRILLKAGEQPADKQDWAKVAFGSDFDALGRDEQRLIEATLEAAKSSERSEAEDNESDEEPPKAEAEDNEMPDEPPSTPPPPAEKDDGLQAG